MRRRLGRAALPTVHMEDSWRLDLDVTMDSHLGRCLGHHISRTISGTGISVLEYIAM